MELIHSVENTLSATNLVIASCAHSLTHDGARYFGLMEIQSQMSGSDDYCWVLGLRNSHDKSFPAGITAGAQVFVCDNSAFQVRSNSPENTPGLSSGICRSSWAAPSAS